MRKILLALPFIAASIFSSCSKDVTAPIVNGNEEKRNTTEVVFDYYSNSQRFPDIDSVKIVNNEDIVVYDDIIDWYTGRGDEFDHINIDIGEINMNDNAPTYELGIGTPRIPYLNTLYAMFSMGRGPDASWYSKNVWDDVANRTK